MAHRAIRPVCRPQRQRGASLIEAMIGFLVVAVGMLATAQWQSRLRQATGLARQQSEAVRVAQQEIETLRAFATRDHSASLSSFADIETAPAHTLDAAVGANTNFALDRQVQTGDRPSLKALAIQVNWPDARGVMRNLRLDTLQAGQAPALALALSQPPLARHASPLLGRHATIPLDALALGDGRSAFKPVSGGTEAWLFDDRSGHIRGRCDGVPAGKTTRQLTAGDLGHCRATDAVLLSGRVRFSSAAAPGAADADVARDPPLPLEAVLSTSSTGHPEPPVCLGEAVKLVSALVGERPRLLTVATGATPATEGLLGWTDTGDRHWRYHCAVTLAPAPTSSSGRTAPQWTGRLQFVPTGWALGTVAGTRRICRYSADTDGSGQVDRPAENTDRHVAVEDALVEQNYLVLDGAASCPARPAATLAGGTLTWFEVNPATVPHQP